MTEVAIEGEKYLYSTCLGTVTNKNIVCVCLSLRVLDNVAKGSAAVRQFEYVFYIDFEASEVDPHAQWALEEVRRFATFVRVLGSYVSHPKIHTLDP